MSSAPQISVILCSYNGARTVGRALESVYQQTMASDRYEVVFVNDGSVDQTEEIVSVFRRYENFRYVKHPMNQGLCASCNRGVREARGTYLIRLDADDRFESTALEQMAWPLERGLTDFVYCDRYEWIEQEDAFRYISLSPFRLFGLIAIGTMMRRSMVLAIGGYRELFWEEYDLYLRYLLESGKPPYHIAKALLTYTIRPGSMSTDMAKAHAGWSQLRRLWSTDRLGSFAAEFSAHLGQVTQETRRAID